MERDERISSIIFAGIMAMACRDRRRKEKREAKTVEAGGIIWKYRRVVAKCESRAVIEVRSNWQLVRDRLGRMGLRRGSEYRRNRVTPLEGSDFSCRRTQEATKDRGIGDAFNNSNQCSEVADG